MFGNLPLLRMKAGERVSWYLVALDGNADMRADNPAIWLEHCHVSDRVKAGMAGRYGVEK